MLYHEFINKIDIIKELENRGIEFKDGIFGRVVMKCEIHKDKDFAFHLNINQDDSYYGIGKCFSCGWRGNIFELLAEIDDVSLKDILRKFKGDISPSEIQKIKDFFKNKLIASQPEKPKIEKTKQLKTKSLSKFVSEFPISVEKYLNSRNLDIKFLKRFGVLFDARKIEKKKGKTKINKFKNWIVFPYIDCENRLRGIVWKNPKEVKKGDLKVYNLPGCECNQMLFGLKRLLENNLITKNLIIVEGESDCLYLQQLKFSAVSIGSKSITESQIKELDLYVPESTNIIIFLDGDVSEEELLNIKYRIKRFSIKNRKVIIQKIKEKNKDPNNYTQGELNLIF